MEEAHHSLLHVIGKALHARPDGLNHETLPERWVELIQYLNEKERARPKGTESQPNAPPGHSTLSSG